MVAIVAGSGLGLFNASPNTLGGASVRGQSVQGQAGASSFVNVATGNLVLQALDEVLSGRGLELPHVRTHNSSGSPDDGDEDGWRWDGERKVVLQGTIGATGSTVTRTDGDGHETVYSWNGSRYVSTEGGGAHDNIAFDSGPQQFVWTDGSSRLLEKYVAATGRLVSQQDVSGNIITFQYDNAGRLSGVTDSASNQRLALSYEAVTGGTRLKRVETVALTVDGSGRPTSTLGSPVKQVEYDYDGSGRLASVKTDLTPANAGDTVMFLTIYTYDGSSTRIATVSQSDGSSASFTYDGSNRVETVTDANGTQTFTYQVVNGGLSTDVSVDVGDGSPQVWTYVTDSSKRLIEIKTPAPADGAARLSTQFQYDADGNVKTVIDARGNSVDYEYDGLGNRRLERDSEGNTVIRTFDSRNQLVTETHHQVPDPDGAGQQTAGNPVTTRFVYDGQSRLRFVVSAEGAVTETRYGTSSAGSGLPTHTVLYTGGRFVVGGLAPQSVLTENQLTTWVGTQDKSQVELTEFAYDLRGNLSKQTDYATVNSSGAGVLDAGAEVTEYIYDAHGDLLQTIAVRGAARDRRTTLSSVVRDGLGRETQSIDAAGTRTTVYDGGNRTIEVTTQAGMVETRGFDTRGRLVSVSRQGGGTTRAIQHVYDTAGRLRMTEDPQGGRRFTFYDAAGRLRFQVDSIGAVTGFEYNVNGQTTAETRYRTLTNTSSWYNPNTKTVTKHSLVIGTDIIVDPANDRTTHYDYDTANRLGTLTDPIGTITETNYDGRSLVTQQQTGDRFARFFYDRDNRKVGMVDALGFLTEYRYDAGGRLSETIRYSNRSPAAPDVATPEWGGVTQQTVLDGQHFELPLPAWDPDGDDLVYRVVGSKPDWLSLDTSTGTAILTGTPPVSAALETTFSVAVQADDQRGETSNLTVGITVINTPPTWSALSNSSTAVGNTGYKVTLPAATSSWRAAQITYSLLSPLPQVLTFDAGKRLLSGNPSQPGVYTLTSRATDQRGLFAQRSFTVTITRSGWPTWTAVPVQELTVGQPFSLTVPAATPAGPGTIEYVEGDMPGWLAFNPTTRVLSGTSASAGFETVELFAQHNGRTTLLSFGLDIAGNAPTLAWAPVSSMVVTAGSPVSYTPPKAMDPKGQSVTYSAVKGLPPGLSVDSATGAITGTTSAVRKHRVVLRATNARGKSVDRTVVLDVKKAGSTTTETNVASEPIDDVLADWRPTNTAGLRSYVFYDSQGRVVGSVDEQGFLSETVYDAEANKQHAVRYLTTVSVVSSDTLTTLKAKAGAAKLTSTVEFDDVGRVSRRVAVDGTVTLNEYDNAGRVVREVVASGTDEQRAERTRFNEFSEVTGTLGGRGEAALPANPTQTDVDAAITGRGMRYEFDSRGRLAKSIDANGHAGLFFYDRESRLTHTINAEREVVETAYNHAGQAESVRRYVNRITADNLNGLAGGPASQLQGKLPAVDQAKDQVMLYEYDRRGCLVKQTDPEGFVTTRTYTAHGQLETETRTIAQDKTVTSRFDYDLRGGVLSKTGDAGGINFNGRTSYDAQGRIVRSVDGAGKVTSTSYGEGGRTVEVTDPFGRKVRSESDALGRMSRTFDGSGELTSFDYDDEARTARVTSPEGVQVTTRKTRHGEILDVIDGEGGTTKYEYNKDGQLTKVTDQDNKVVRENTYDDSGRLATTTDGRGMVVRLDYDAADRVRERHIDPAADDVKTSYEFNALGQQVKVTEGAGTSAELATTYEYDRKGQLRQVIVDPNGLALSTRYSFDGLGNTVTIEQGTVANPSEQVTAYEFDKLGRKAKQIVAPSAVLGNGTPGTRDLTTEYRYDAAGRISRVTDPNGEHSWNVYDAAGQLTHVINAEGEVSTSSYDVNGRLVQTRRYINRLGATTLATFGDVASAVTPTAREDDQRSILVYDKDGRLRFTLTAAQDAGWVISESRHDANGNVVESRRYDKFLTEARINALDTASSPGISVAEVNAELAELGYGGEDTLTHVQRTRFAYHANNRLRFTVDALGAVSENVYDPMGALVATVRYAVKPSLSTYTQNVINAAVDRNNAGNQITRFAYDTQGRLRFTLRVAATNGQGVATQHLVSEQAYDALGRHTSTTEYATVVGQLADYRAATIAGAVTANALDRREMFVYDTAGRQVYRVRVLTTGAQGKHLVTKTEYDALGRTVQRTAFAKEMGLADYAKATLDTAVTANKSNHDRTTSLVYDAAGRHRFTIAADSTLSETVYDAAGRVIEKREFDLVVASTTPRTDAALSQLRGSRHVGDNVTRGEKYTYDRVGRVMTTTDAKGFTEINAYNGLGDRTTHTDKEGAVCTYTYDRRGMVFRKINPPVEVFVQLKNQDAPVLQETVLEDRTYHDAFGNLVKTVERINTADARTTEYHYDTLGRLTSTFLPGYHDPDTGRVEKTSETGRLRREVRLTYDALGNVVRTRTHTGPDTSHSEYKTYDRLRRLVHDIDALNHVIAFNYTPFGEQHQVTKHSVTITGSPANSSHWTVDEIADKVDADTRARTVTTFYDNAGRRTESRQPSADYYHGDQNQRKNAVTVTPVSAHATTLYEHNAFDAVRRESVKVNATEWRETRHYFDKMGREVFTVDGLDHPTKQTYDKFGNLTETIEYAKAGVTAIDADTPPTATDSADDRVMRFGYDVLNQRTQVDRRRDGGTTFFSVMGITYDKSGRVKTQTDAAIGITHLEYNALGQLTKTTEPSRVTASDGAVDPFVVQVSVSPVTALTLDGFGNVVKQSRTPGSNGDRTASGDTLVTNYDRDVAGNIFAAFDAMGNGRFREYDYAGRIVRETQPNNVTMKDWITNAQTLERRYAYDASGRQTDTIDVFKEGTATHWSGLRSVFNAFGELSEERRIWKTPTTQGDAIVTSYSHDDVGQVEERTASDGVTRFFYNLTGQVTRQEQRDDPSTNDGSTTRVTETGYDRLGRARIQRLPAFSAFTGADLVPITPLALQEFDRWGNVVGRTEGRYVRDDTGAVLGNADTTKYKYNADNQLAEERLPTVQAVRADGSAYDANLRHELRYDLMGRVVQEIDLSDVQSTPADEATVLRTRTRLYDTVGQLVKETDGTGIATQYAYDGHGRRVGVRNAMGRVFVDTFDKNGNLLTHSVVRGLQPAAHVLTRHQYDQANRRVGTAESLSDAVVAWSFTKLDERGYARINRDPLERETTCDYDILGNKTLEQGPIDQDQTRFTQSWVYSLNQTDHTVGRLVSTTVAGRTTNYFYNDFGQLRHESHGGGNTRSYEYKPSGLLARVQETYIKGTPGLPGGADFRTSNAASTYEYTPKGQVAKEHFDRSGSFENGSDDDGDGDFDSMITIDEPTIIRNTFITYDALGRMVKVEVPDNPDDPNDDLLRVTYSYDELNNRRNILGEYGRPWADPGQRSDKWYTYDAEGRATIVDGEKVNGQITQARGTLVTYDALGRRKTADKFITHREVSVQGGPTLKYDQFRVEEYSYSDLNHLTSVLGKEAQRNKTLSGVPQPDSVSSNHTYVELRGVDLRGDLLSSDLKINESGGELENVDTRTTFTPRLDGTLQEQTTTDRDNPARSSTVTYFHDTAGILRKYTYEQEGKADDDNQPNFTLTYNHFYSKEFGGNRVSQIKVTSTLPSTKEGNTGNIYDLAGRLWHQRTDLPGESLRVRTFAYDTGDRGLMKTETVFPQGSAPRPGRQDLLYVDGRQVAVVGNGELRAAIFSNVFTPISGAYPAATPSSHVVRDGDTLAGIAQLTFGDSTLWYLIAEANGLRFSPDKALPSTERGKTYRIPNVVANVHNDANTFKPYSLADIIGDAAPAPRYVPPPPDDFDLIDLAKVVAVVAAAIVVTYLTAGAATGALVAVAGQTFAYGAVGTGIALGVGAAAGSIASQGMAMSMGMQDELSFRQVAAAAIGGAIGGFLAGAIGEGGGIAVRLMKEFTGWVGQQFGNGIAGIPVSPASARLDLGLTMGFALGGKYLGGRWNGAAKQFTAGALDPQSGWLIHDKARTWQNIANQAASAVTGVVVGAGVAWAYELLLNHIRGQDQRSPYDTHEWPDEAHHGRRRKNQYGVLVADNDDGSSDYGSGQEFIFVYRNPKTGKLEDYGITFPAPGYESIDPSDPNVRREVDAETGEHWWVVVDPYTGRIYPVGPVLLVPVGPELRQSKLPEESFAEAGERMRVEDERARVIQADVKRLDGMPFVQHLKEIERIGTGVLARTAHHPAEYWKDGTVPIEIAGIRTSSREETVSLVNSAISIKQKLYEGAMNPVVYPLPASTDTLYGGETPTISSPDLTVSANFLPKPSFVHGGVEAVQDGHLYRQSMAANSSAYKTWESRALAELRAHVNQGYRSVAIGAGVQFNESGALRLDLKSLSNAELLAWRAAKEFPNVHFSVLNVWDPGGRSLFNNPELLKERSPKPGGPWFGRRDGAVLRIAGWSDSRVGNPVNVVSPGVDVSGPWYAEGRLGRVAPHGVVSGLLNFWSATTKDHPAIAALAYIGAGADLAALGAYTVGATRGSQSALVASGLLRRTAEKVLLPVTLHEAYGDVTSDDPFRQVAAPFKVAGLRYPYAALAAVLIQFGGPPLVDMHMKHVYEYPENADFYLRHAFITM